MLFVKKEAKEVPFAQAGATLVKGRWHEHRMCMYLLNTPVRLHIVASFMHL